MIHQVLRLLHKVRDEGLFFVKMQGSQKDCTSPCKFPDFPEKQTSCGPPDFRNDKEDVENDELQEV